MSKHATERVTCVHHWNDTLFSFRTTRTASLRFRNGEFIMIGLPNEDAKPTMRAYSIASANHDEHLEFFSIKVQDGALTSRLQHLQVGDDVLIGSKPTGTLLLRDLNPGKNLYLLATGTGLAPFLSVVQDPETYERFDKVVLTHGVRQVSELAYSEWLTNELPAHEYLGDLLRDKLIYFPTVSREDFHREGRITDHIESGRLAEDTGLPQLNPETDRAMICGSASMLTELSEMLNARGFEISAKTGVAGDYVIERAFVER
ncbi:MAG: ferredoxin--NADP reductase [Pseudomonadota bacterium]